MKLFKLLLSVVLCMTLAQLYPTQIAWGDDDSSDRAEASDLNESAAPSPPEGEEDGTGDTGSQAPGAASTWDTEEEPNDSGFDEETGVGGQEEQGSDSGDDNETGMEPLAPGNLIVSYRAHVARVGWQAWVQDGVMAGTTGRSLAIEGLCIELPSGTDGSIRYRATVAGVGLQSWVANGALAGTTGQSRQMEIIRIELQGAVASQYDVYYRVHCANLGWLGWTKNGDPAGTAGYGYSLQAIEVVLVETGQAGPSSAINAFVSKALILTYRSHVQNIGWQAWVGDGALAGTTGRSLRMEAMNIDLVNPGHSGAIQYRAHVQNIGWQPWSSSGMMTGTTGRSLQMEAVQIRLTGEMATIYDVYYKAHSSQFGWLSWAKNGAEAGTTGSSCTLEALMVLLVPKTGGMPPVEDSTWPSYIPLNITARAHVANMGWLVAVGNSSVVGTTGRSLRMEAFTLNTTGQNIPGGFIYRAHVANFGWQDWVMGGDVAGTTGESRQIEAIQIRLTGEWDKYFDVYYRVNAGFYGWLGWARNGAMAGTTKCGIAMEAFQIKLVPKGSRAPGSTSGAYSETPPLPPVLLAMNARAASMSSPTPWLIVIDTYNNWMGIYYGSRGNWTAVHYWRCSTGAWRSPTVTGVFSVGSRGYSFGSGFTCYWWVQIYGNYLMHSVLYYQGTNVILDGTMGAHVSHGCVRLDIQNAKWIYDNIPYRTTILSYR